MVHGIERFTATMQGDNRPAHALMAKLRARLASQRAAVAPAAAA